MIIKYLPKLTDGTTPQDHVPKKYSLALAGHSGVREEFTRFVLFNGPEKP
jgi:hypothetical protein